MAEKTTLFLFKENGKTGGFTSFRSKMGGETGGKLQGGGQDRNLAFHPTYIFLWRFNGGDLCFQKEGSHLQKKLETAHASNQKGEHNCRELGEVILLWISRRLSESNDGDRKDRKKAEGKTIP